MPLTKVSSSLFLALVLQEILRVKFYQKFGQFLKHNLM